MLRVDADTELERLSLSVSVEVPAGACVALAGPSGAGKTTVLRIAAGLAQPRRGLVVCAGERWLDTERGERLPPERRRCGYVFQDYALFGHMRAWQNVAYGIRGGSRAERRRRAHELLERLGAGPLADARPDSLSGGERQRVALARALAVDPSALLLDEPLSALDATSRARAARELIGVIRDAGVPTLFVTHDFTEAALLGDSIAVLDRGRIVQRGSASDVAASPASAFVADFTGAVVLTGTAARGPDALTHVALDGGGEVVALARASGPVAVSVYPWEITVEPAGATRTGSAQNRLDCRVLSVASVGERVRVGLAAAQPLVAEISESSARRLGLEPGVEVVAAWKAAATRVLSQS